MSRGKKPVSSSTADVSLSIGQSAQDCLNDWSKSGGISREIKMSKAISEWFQMRHKPSQVLSLPGWLTTFCRRCMTAPAPKFVILGPQNSPSMNRYRWSRAQSISKTNNFSSHIWQEPSSVSVWCFWSSHARRSRNKMELNGRKLRVVSGNFPVNFMTIRHYALFALKISRQTPPHMCAAAHFGTVT